ncbi:MAG: MFS transporter [Clostridia bacterium]|nr:MFS transporter [Clostridia bacterium]
MVFLLVVIYIAFIGLGVPDSLIGSAWPAIRTDLHVPLEAVSILTLLISGCTVLSSIFSARILNKFGTAKVTAISTAMTAAALFGFSAAPSFGWMIPLAVLLGLGAGAIDSGLNHYVALHFKASHMNYLHCFYGVGVTLSPYLMTMALGNVGWRSGYRYAFYVQAAITLLLVLSLPQWKKGGAAAQETEAAPANLSVRQMAKRPDVRQVWVVMLATNAIEYACGVWGSTYLVAEKGYQAKYGALALTIYYAGMSIGRFVSGLISGRIDTWRRIGIGAAIIAPAIVVMLLPLPGAATVAGLFLVGLGNGSIYPNMIHLTPHNFGSDISQSVMGSQIAFAYIGVMLSPPLVALVGRVFGLKAYPVLLAVLYGVMIVSLLLFSKQMKKQGRYDTKL